ncbi:MAG: enoyl-CoA hydratase/isomerase family protein [Chloroflexota bacterium]|nr:enoyl-CoA hydratase/isomerase family protein [Chloroflexota bacterium]
MEADFLFTREGPIATFTLNRPQRRNAFSDEMMAQWAAAIVEAQRDDRVRAVVVTGAGSAFCGGGDLEEILRWRSEDPITRKAHLWQSILRVPLSLKDLDKPIIAAVNGPAIGAGCDMALMCDIRIASEKAVFAESYVLVGLVPGDGGAFFLPRLVGLAKACELLFTGETISAVEAERIGLVNRVVPHEELLPKAYAMAERIASMPAVSVRLTKRLIYQGLQSDVKTALDMSSSFIAHVIPLEETVQAMERMLERLRGKPEERGKK